MTSHRKIITSVLAIVLLVALGYILFNKYGAKNGQVPQEDNTALMEVVVEHTPRTNGVLPVPTEFPQDIPVEKTSIVESATSVFSDLNARQLTVSYQSKKTVGEKYTEYKNYMTEAGYTLSEGGTGANLKSVFGTKENINLTVVISKAEVGSLVQIAYLLK